LVNDLRKLDRYRWCGHSAILGNRKNQLIPKRPPNDAPSADRRIAISLLHQGTEKAKTNPEDPACPVKFRQDSVAYFTGINPACRSEAPASGPRRALLNSALTEPFNRGSSGRWYWGQK